MPGKSLAPDEKSSDKPADTTGPTQPDLKPPSEPDGPVAGAQTPAPDQPAEPVDAEPPKDIAPAQPQVDPDVPPVGASAFGPSEPAPDPQTISSFHEDLDLPPAEQTPQQSTPGQGFGGQQDIGGKLDLIAQLLTDLLASNISLEAAVSAQQQDATTQTDPFADIETV
jgi:hypothetical protein